MAVAQTITGSIRGTVTDPSGAVVAGANVTATNVATNVATQTVTNSDGLYNFQFLNLGDYTISASSSGFSTATIGPFRLQIDQIAKINVKLQVGAAATTVNVAAGAGALLNTENATLGTTISSNTLQNMPLNGLNANFATMFVPGAVNPTVSAMGGLLGSASDQDPAGGQTSDAIPSYNGNRQQANNYVLDGVEINEPVANTLGYNESPFAIGETRVITANADAEYGNVNGAEVVIVTKSGTNQFHGNGFEYFENQNLADNTFNNKYGGVAKSHFSQHQFGGSVGGPIFKNKLFFFADYEGLRFSTPPSQATYSVPDAKERTGDFSEVLAVEGIQLYNTAPTATNPTGGYANPTPYPNNQIPAILNPVAKFLFANPNVYPLPNHPAQPNTVTSGNYLGIASSKTNNDQADGRLDYTVTGKDTLMLKFSHGDAHDGQSQTVVPVIFPITDDFPFYNAVINWIHTFSPSLVNEARVGFSRIGANTGIVTDPSGVFGLKGNSLVGIPLPGPQQLPGFTYQAFAGAVENQAFGTNPYDGVYTTDNNFYYGDDLTWQHGNHITKFGAEILRYQNDYFNPSNLGGLLGDFAYNGQYSQGPNSPGFGYADFELDNSTGAQISGVAGLFGQRQYRDAFYAQDDWKVLPNLTVNLGLRYEYDQPIYEANNKMVSIDLAKAKFNPTAPLSSLLLFAGKNGNSRALYNPYYFSFMPRFGFDLQVNPRTVLRGGYGITNYLEGTGNGLRMTQNAPFQASFTLTAGNPGPTNPGAPLRVENGFAGGTSSATGSQYDVWDPNLRPAVVQQFNLTTEYLINNSTSAQLGYVGELGQHLAVPVQANQYIAPCAGGAGGDPACLAVNAPYYSAVGGGNLIETVSQGTENYNAMQAMLRHQQSNGLEYSLNYTWAKAMTNNAGGYFSVGGLSYNGGDSFWQNTYDPRADNGPSDFDVRNNLTGTAVYQLPFGRGKKYGGNWNRLTDETLGGWQLSGNAILYSGLPVTIMTIPTTSDINGPGNLDYIQRANQFGQPKVVNRSLQHWFGTDPSATPCTTPGASINSLGAVCTFGLAAQNKFGTSQQNTERAPGFRQIDLSLFKAFRTFGSQDFKLRVDAFNAFNISSYSGPGNYIGSSRYGLINGTASPARQFQISGVYTF
jgi:hypothetical protein